MQDLIINDHRVSVGKGTYASGDPTIWPHHANNKIVIGNYCCLAKNVTIFSGGNHPMNYITDHPLKLYFGISEFPEWSKDCGDDYEVTTIGSDVWLGDGATVMSGATIGHGAVIGARAVVRGKVPPYAVVSGNPATIIKKRFSEDIIEKLLNLKWWDWPEDKIKQAIPYLCSENIEQLLDFDRGEI